MNQSSTVRTSILWEQPYSVVRGFANARIDLAILRATNLCRHAPMSEHSPKSNTTPLIEKPSSKSNSTTLSKHKNAPPRATNSKQEQPIDIDPNTILRNT
jgi:hypothetical protein